MTINEYFNQYYDVLCNGDLSNLDQFFHSDSPFLQGVKSQYEAIRKQLEMTIKLESIELVAKQDDLLVIRDKILFEGNKDGAIKKSRTGNLHVMTKKNDDEWKVQSTSPLTVESA